VDSEGVEGDYTPLMFRDTLIHLEVGAVDQNNKPLNGRAHIVITGYPDGATLDGNTDTSVKLTNGAWHGYLPGLEQVGNIHFEVDIPSGWRRLQSNVMSGSVSVVAAPMRFNYWSEEGYISYDELDEEDMGTLIYYTSPTRTIPLNVGLLPESHPWNNPDDPRLTPTGLIVESVFDGVEQEPVTVTSGECTIQLPTTMKPKSTILELIFRGDNVYSAETKDIPVEILQNRAVLVVEAPELALVNTSFDLVYHVVDLYGDPLNLTVLATYSSYGIKETSHTDENGEATIPVTPNRTGMCNITCSAVATGYTSKASKVVNVQVLSEPVTPTIEILTEELYKGATNQLRCRVTYQNKPVHEGRVIAKIQGKVITGEDGKRIFFNLNTVEDGLVTIPATIAQTSSVTSATLTFTYSSTNVYNKVEESVTVPVLTPEGGGQLINNSILPSIEPITTTIKPTLSWNNTLIRWGYLKPTITPSSNTISQNDTFTLPVGLELTYTDGKLNEDIPIEIIIHNKTKNQYISTHNNTTHQDTYGTIRPVTLFKISKCNISFDTETSIYLQVNQPQPSALGWEKTDTYHIYIVQEDNVIDFDVQY
jgi:hypothetical protein